jgi:hypothetical protein
VFLVTKETTVQELTKPVPDDAHLLMQPVPDGVHPLLWNIVLTAYGNRRDAWYGLARAEAMDPFFGICDVDPSRSNSNPTDPASPQ